MLNSTNSIIDGMEPIRIQISTIDKPHRQVKVGIDSPDEVEIWREQLMQIVEVEAT